MDQGLSQQPKPPGKADVIRTLPMDALAKDQRCSHEEVHSLLEMAWAGQELPDPVLADKITQLSRILDRPPIVELETINVCNSRCRFCISRLQNVKKCRMDETLFEDISRQIAAQGTQQLCLVPLLGDPLLDDDVVRHAALLREVGNIGMLRLVTNGLALDRFCDEDLLQLLQCLDRLEISIGPNAYVYKAMFGVDRFEHLIANLERLARLVAGMSERHVDIVLVGRACGENFGTDLRLFPVAQILTGKATIVWTREYMDWGGLIEELPLSTPVIRIDQAGKAVAPCHYSLTPHIHHDGRVGLCACVGASDDLRIGDLQREPWRDVLRSKNRLALIFSFLSGNMPQYCQRCSFYIPAKMFDWDALTRLVDAMPAPVVPAPSPAVTPAPADHAQPGDDNDAPCPRRTQRSLEHLATLQLPLRGVRVLVAGADIGDHCGFYLDRGCHVVCREARPENLAVLEQRFGREPRLELLPLSPDDPGPNLGQSFDVVHCRDPLLQAQRPERALRRLAERCVGLLLLEARVWYETTMESPPAPESAGIAGQAPIVQGCRPTRPWLWNRLKTLFPHVYVPRTQPSHAEFPLDWTVGNDRPGLPTRCLFVASRRPLYNPLLAEELLPGQEPG